VYAHAGNRVNNIELNPELLIVTVSLGRQPFGIPDNNKQVGQRRKEPADENEKGIADK
jgi:hypothetical protein